MLTIDLSGKTALVTGGSQGLGRCTATRLHAAGATVGVNYFPDPQGLNRGRAEETVAALGERAFAVGGDVRDVADVSRMCDEVVSRTGKLDIVVNNAAIIRDRTLKKMSEDEWQDVIDTNLTGVFHVCRAAAERMADGGRIVNMASISSSSSMAAISVSICSNAAGCGGTHRDPQALLRVGVRCLRTRI